MHKYIHLLDTFALSLELNITFNFLTCVDKILHDFILSYLNIFLPHFLFTFGNVSALLDEMSMWVFSYFTYIGI